MTGEPVRGARVTVMQLPIEVSNQVGEPIVHSTTTGAGGEFSISGVSYGAGFIQASKAGYFETPPLSKTLDITQQNASVALQLQPLGTLDGTVLSQAGDPLRNATVGLFQFLVEQGYKEVKLVQTKTTNDRGEYRFWDLMPGRFYPKVLNRAGGTRLYVGDSIAEPDTWESFHPVYWGGSQDINSAVPVEIAFGSHARADFKLEVQPTHRIRGAISGLNSPQGLTFQLLQGDSNVVPQKTSMSTTTAQFEIDDVAPGQYTLQITQRGARFEKPLTVNRSNIDGLVVELAPPATLTGVTHIAGTVANGQEGSGPGLGGPNCRIMLGTTRESLSLGGRIGRTEGSRFTISPVLSGNYHASITCSGAYPTSAMYGTTDLMSGSLLTVLPGVEPPPIEITAKAGGGRIHGTIDRPGTDPEDFPLLLVPTTSAGTAREGRINKAWGFDLDDLAPGDYRIFAGPQFKDLEYRNPDILRGLTGGIAVHVEDGKTVEVKLTGPTK